MPCSISELMLMTKMSTLKNQLIIMQWVDLKGRLIDTELSKYFHRHCINFFKLITI